MLNESYLARFEKNSGLKKGTVSNLNGLYESYMQDARDNGDEYKFFIVLNGKIVGGNDYKEDAIDLQNEYAEGGVRAQVFTGRYLKGKGIDPENDANWGDSAHIDAATGRNSETGMMPGHDAQVQQEGEGTTEVLSQEVPDEDEFNDEPENDKDAESQDDLHLGEDDSEFSLQTHKNNRPLSRFNGGRAAAADSQINATGFRKEFSSDPHNGNAIKTDHRNALALSKRDRGDEDDFYAKRSLPENSDVWSRNSNNELSEELSLDPDHEYSWEEIKKAGNRQMPFNKTTPRADVANQQNNAAKTRRNLPDDSLYNHLGKKISQAQTDTGREGRKELPKLPEGLEMSEDSKELYKEAKINENYYNRFLKNAGLLK